MKHLPEIKAAKRKICEALATPGLNDIQRANFAGMIVGINWASELGPADTIDRLIAGEPIAAGKDPSNGLETLNKLPGIAGRE